MERQPYYFGGVRRKKIDKMRGIVGRKLNLCFSKMKRPFSPDSPPNPTSLNSESSPDDHPSSSSSSSLSSSSSSSILIKNFNSLYDHTFDSYEPEAEPADLASAFASERFFFSSPGRSNSIIQSPSSPEQPHAHKLLTNSVAVPTYSPDPYMDFRLSMREMVEARPELMDVKSNWEMLQELLLCYLALNPRTTHKFIVGAFADLLVTLTLPPQEEADGESLHRDNGWLAKSQIRHNNIITGRRRQNRGISILSPFYSI